jgi:hypothetical protein
VSAGLYIPAIWTISAPVQIKRCSGFRNAPLAKAKPQNPNIELLRQPPYNWQGLRASLVEHIRSGRGEIATGESLFLPINLKVKKGAYVEKIIRFFIYLALIMLINSSVTTGCHEQRGNYIAASSISKNGFAINGDEMRKEHGQEIMVWGFVDHSNIYGDDGAKKILEDWWSGDGPNATTWSFNLKANEEDEAGRSFPVRVPNDPGRDDLLKAFLADARAHRPTRVFVKGKLFTFDAPANVRRFTGLSIERFCCISGEGPLLVILATTKNSPESPHDRFQRTPI